LIGYYKITLQYTHKPREKNAQTIKQLKDASIKGFVAQQLLKLGKRTHPILMKKLFSGRVQDPPLRLRGMTSVS
jgi:hypothetical protein